MEIAKIKSLFVSTDITIKQAMQKINETAEKILFVVDEKEKLLGTVTDGDIRRGIVSGLEFNVSVKSIMQKEFAAITNNTPQLKEHAKKMMFETRLEHIPVVDERNNLLDVILWTDFIEEDAVKEKHLYANQVVIMAGGKGTRLDPFTKVLPKPLIPIGDRPIIDIIMEKFYKYGFHKFIYTLNYKKEYIKLFLKDNKFPYTVDWVEESDFCGTAGSLSLIKDKVKEPFFVTNCDSLLNIDLEEVLSWHTEQKAAMTIIGCHNEVEIPFGTLQFNNGRLASISEKPVYDLTINTGVYVMEPRILSYISTGKRIDMNELINLVLRNEKITVFPIYEGWFDMGQWKKYIESTKKLEMF